MENKKTKIISIVAMVALALTVITATYAYFNASVGDPAAADIKINANTVDTFTFATGNQITLNLDQESFASGKGNITGSTYASALLTANNKTNTATEHYYLYLNIEDNTFTYSINESTPEIIMTIKNSAGAEVTDIGTLNHVIVTGANNTQVSGYDITNKNGLITLFNNREITTTSSKEEKWNITITFVNYDASQNANAGKIMSAKVMIQKNKLPEVVSDVCSNGDNLATCVTTLANKSTSSLTNIYYHVGTIKSTNSFDVITYNSYGKKVTTTYPVGTILDANDKSYRYAGASENVNNFVCFGTNTTPCPTDNLYRIIGVFGDRVKLIKYDYATNSLLGTDGDYDGANTPYAPNYKGSLTTLNAYYWNYKADTSNYNNTWSTSLLNKTNLNTNFVTNIGSEWANKIATTTWKVGGNTEDNIRYVVPSIAYQNEIKNPTPGSTSKTGETEYNAQIGLMYVSDYGYAASPTYWTYPGVGSSGASSDYRAATTSNWMYMGYNEWTISRSAGSWNNAYLVTSTGIVSYGNVNNSFGVRPSFNLLSSVTYSSGTGTSSDPIRINL